MYKIDLSVFDEKELKEAIKEEKNAKLYRRLQCILMKSEGMKNIKLSEYLGVSNNRITSWIKLYLEGGLSKLLKLNYEHNSKSKLDIYQEEIREFVESRVIKNSMEINDFLEKEHGLKIDNSWLVKYLKKNSIYLIKRRN